MGKWHEEAKRMKPFIQKGIQTLEDADALKIKMVYPKWEDLIKLGSVEAEAGFKFLYGEDLYSCRDANPRFQADWIPGLNTASMYVRIDETHAGTLDDPIPAARNMKYTYFLYYLDPENSKTYLCQYGETDTQGTITLAYLPHEVPAYFKEVNTG